VLSASRAVAVIGPAEGRRHREADATAEARAVEWTLRARLCGRVRWTRPGHDESLDPAAGSPGASLEESDRGVGHRRTGMHAPIQSRGCIQQARSPVSGHAAREHRGDTCPTRWRPSETKKRT
jgi:hypothetical protein